MLSRSIIVFSFKSNEHLFVFGFSLGIMRLQTISLLPQCQRVNMSTMSLVTFPSVTQKLLKPFKIFSSQQRRDVHNHQVRIPLSSCVVGCHQASVKRGFLRSLPPLGLRRVRHWLISSRNSHVAANEGSSRPMGFVSPTSVVFMFWAFSHRVVGEPPLQPSGSLSPTRGNTWEAWGTPGGPKTWSNDSMMNEQIAKQEANAQVYIMMILAIKQTKNLDMQINLHLKLNRSPVIIQTRQLFSGVVNS